MGVVPAAGRAKRIAPLPCSKEIYPVGLQEDETGTLRPRAASHHLLQKFRRAGAASAFIVVRDGKWDIPAYYGDGGIVDLPLAYVVIGGSMGPPDTVDRAWPFLADALVAFGFPDILFGPDDVFERLRATQGTTGADMVLGLFPAHDIRHMDMVDVASDGRVLALHLKPRTTTLTYGWICALWTPAFTGFLHSFVAEERGRVEPDRSAWRDIDPQGDLPFGAAIRAAVERGLHVHGVPFPDETYLDIGTPENLLEAIRRQTGRG